jgi:hypothetical protein
MSTRRKLTGPTGPKIASTSKPIRRHAAQKPLPASGGVAPAPAAARPSRTAHGQTLTSAMVPISLGVATEQDYASALAAACMIDVQARARGSDASLLLNAVLRAIEASRVAASQRPER